MVRDRLARLDEFVAGGDHDDGGLRAHADARHAGSRSHGDLGCSEAHSGLQQQRPLSGIAATAVNVLSAGDLQAFNQRHLTFVALQLLDWNDGITALREYGASHDFDGVLGAR